MDSCRLVGDFNMTETKEDRILDYLEKTMGVREQYFQTDFALALGISHSFYLDDFKRINKKRHTWCPTSAELKI